MSRPIAKVMKSNNTTLVQILRFGAVFLLIVLFSACTTRKKQDDLSMMGKLYHNTTAKYNGYFNANELLQGSILQLEQQYQDNYTQVLPMYEYIAADNPQAVAPDLDQAIEKVTVVANLHRRSQWTDDCYLLLGKAQFLKKDYEGAEQTLRFMTEEFKPSKEKAKKEAAAKGKKSGSRTASSRTGKKADSSKKEAVQSKKEKERARKKYNRELKKKRKKGGSAKGPKTAAPPPNTDGNTTPKENPAKPDETVEEPVPTTIRLSDSGSETIESDPDSYFMKHRPAYQEGLLWLAKTYIERDNPDGAIRILSQLEKDPKTFKDISAQTAAVMAHHYITLKKYAEAIPFLEKTIELGENRIERARFSYIKAQLNQKLGQNEAAYASFEQVVKYTDNYEMEFSARLNLAQNAWRTGKGSGEDARLNLEKMLKDPKNEEYRDQVYYALAEIALAQNDQAAGEANLQNVIKYSSGNRALEAEVYYLLANMAFKGENYISAKQYFDNALERMNTSDERYDEVRRYSTNLTEIAQNLTIIQEKDSLLRIAELPEDEKLKLAGKIKKDRDQARLEEAQAKAAEAATGPKGPAPALIKSDFFAYNDKALKRGEKEFQRRWGSRQLEDDWRRSNRRSISESEGTGTEAGPETVALDPSNLSEYLGAYPKTEQEIEEFRIQIREAMFKLGALYRDRMKNYAKSVVILEDLNTRFPASNYELDSWYLLYLDHTDLNNSAAAKSYFDKIIAKYPTTNYAKLLQDPEYAAKFMSEERIRNQQYDQIYQDFKQGKYQAAFEQGQQALSQLFGKHPLKAKYALLLAMCTGNMKGKDAYVEDLQKVVALYPDSDEQRKAKEILRMLGGAGAKLPGQAEEENAGGYVYNPDELHYMIIVFNQEVALNDVKFVVSDYNEKYHSLEKLRISNIYMGEKQETPVLVLRRFKNAGDAMKYYDGVTKNAKDFLDPKKYNFDLLPVSQNNYRIIISTKAIDVYKKFFESNY